jgi:hypothetical protein
MAPGAATRSSFVPRELLEHPNDFGARADAGLVCGKEQ